MREDVDIVVEPVWQTGPKNPVLDAGALHAWCASLNPPPSVVSAYYEILSPDERERADRFYFEHDRRHFTVARGSLRKLLGLYLQMDPSDIEFYYGEKGKPSLAWRIASENKRAFDLYFNISHSGGLGLFGFFYGTEIGVDIEKYKEMRDAESIATHYFCKDEVAVFLSLPESQRDEGFFNCWSRKEAYIKATGDGLSMPLDRFEVSLFPGEPARFISVDGDTEEAKNWFLRELEPAPGYAAAVCMRGPEPRLEKFTWRHEA